MNRYHRFSKEERTYQDLVDLAGCGMRARRMARGNREIFIPPQECKIFQGICELAVIGSTSGSHSGAEVTLA